MIDELTRRWVWLIASVACVASVSGILLGWLSKSAGWGFCALAVFVGLMVGVVMSAFRWPTLSERIITGVIALVLGLGLFVWTSHLPVWRAETAVADDKINDLCIRVVALRMCHERKIMGVFDFNDVPMPIYDEAKQRVTTMPQQEKLAICDQTFGKRINDNISAGSTGIDVLLANGIWVVLALVGLVVPDVIKKRIRYP